MAKYGKKVSKLATVDKKKLKPPYPVVGMHETARTVWMRVVKAYPPDFFKPQHFDLLRMYCESAAVNKIAMRKYVESDYEDAKYLRIADKMAGRCQGLAVKLGINVNNRMAHRGQTGKAPEPKNKRDRLLFGGKG